MANNIIYVERLDRCSKCGGDLEYKGIGEFQCVECGNLEYNSYGKVRDYIEKHPGATTDAVSRNTGVSKSRIREFLLEEKIEIAPGSKTFLSCLRCGAEIRSGRLCEKCKKEFFLESNKSDKAGAAIKQGFLANQEGPDSGKRRFKREDNLI